MSSATLPAALLALLLRDLRLAVRNRSEALAPLLFLVMVTTLFPLGLGPDPKQLALIAPGVVWVAALLASMLSLNHLFSSDYLDGTLEQMTMAPYPLPALVAVKVFAHWLASGLPLVLIGPILAIALNLPAQTIGVMFLSLLIGTPILSMVGAIGVALTVGLRRGGMFLSMLVLPLFIPVLIFATAAVVSAADGMSAASNLYFLGAMLVLALTLTPYAMAAALRISLS